MDFVHNQEHINEDAEDDGMPPLVDKPDSSSTYTFLLDSASPSLANVDSSQVTPSTINLASSSNTPTTDPSSVVSHSPPPSPLNPDGQAMSTTSTTRTRSKSTRGAQGKKREATGHIPRPPNAFILFRSSFIRSNQIPDTLEPNHSNLSKIIGHCWKALSNEERAEWEAKAVIAQEQHRQEFPDWRFRPVPYATSKHKTKDGGTSGRRRASKAIEPADHLEGKEDGAKEDGRKTRGKGKEKVVDVSLRNTRCEKIATLMMVEGKTGSELTIAMEEWEDMNKRTASGSQMKAPPLRDDRNRLTPLSPGPSSPSLASSPDRHSIASSSAAERSPDPIQASVSSQSPSTTTLSESTKATDATQDAGMGKAPAKPPPKGISTIPLTQMFTRSHSSTYPSTSPPSIADLCPPSQFDNCSPSASRSIQPGYDKPQTHAPSIEYRFPQHSHWPTEDHIPSYGSQSDQGAYWQWQTQPDLREGSSDKQRSQDFPQREMGYETDSTVMGYDTYGKSFGSADLPPDGSEVISWTTNPNRHGLMTVINDPLDDPPSVLTGSFGAANPSTHPTSPLTIQPPFYYQPPADLSPSPLNLPATSFSTLTGWAGEYSYLQQDRQRGNFDKMGGPSDGSPKLSDSGSWYPQQGSWLNSSRQNDHQIGMVLSPDDWDRVEDLDLRRNHH